MQRMLKYLLFVLILFTAVLPTYGDNLTAQDIFEGMIYYENDQLAAARHSDYHCTVTQNVVMANTRTQQIMEKDVYFMVPVYQLDMFDNHPAHIFVPDTLITTLEIQELEKLRDTDIDGVPCFVIRLTPRDRIFERFPTTHYVAKEDFRKVRTVNIGSWEDHDSVTKTLDYTYTEVDGMMLLDAIVAVTTDMDENLLHTVTAAYSDYEFDIGLTETFFTRHISDSSVNPTWN